ncbi:MAG TPA: hypothetical protein VHF51_05130, partial [Solirubrobacteraceae bacterium]|nr:hypothetical protein [Solirubrobacteraceae bacterium]
VPATKPNAAPAPQPAAPRLGGVAVAPVLSQVSVRRTGVPVTLKVPAGAKVVQIKVVRAGATAKATAATARKPLATLYRFPARAGTLRTKLSTPALRRLLKPGSYQLRVRAGATKKQLGAATIKRFRVRR